MFPVWLLTWYREAFKGHGTKFGWQGTHPVGIGIADPRRSGPHLCSIRSPLPHPDARPVTEPRRNDHDPSPWKLPVCLFSRNRSSNNEPVPASSPVCKAARSLGQLRILDEAKAELAGAVILLWSISTCYTPLSSAPGLNLLRGNPRTISREKWTFLNPSSESETCKF